MWKVADEEEVLSINIPLPRGEAKKLWWFVTNSEARKRIDAAVRWIVPTRLSFSPDGKQRVGETDAGYLTIHDSRTGETQRPANTTSVGMFLAMQMIALHEVPADVPEFTVDLTQAGSPMLVSRQTDGWWQQSRRTKAIRQHQRHVDRGLGSFVQLTQLLQSNRHVGAQSVALVKRAMPSLITLDQEKGAAQISPDENSSNETMRC